MNDVDPKRSALMARVKGKNTKPELLVRRVAHALGYRYRLHCRNLPGSPDLVFPRYRKTIFVHGCFWHRHSNCRKAIMPKAHAEFWRAKFDANIARDRRNIEELRCAGWESFIVWECETGDLNNLRARLRSFLNSR